MSFPSEPNSRFLTSAKKFWERDYLEDVNALNKALAKPGSESAGFVDIPPCIFTGNPASLLPGMSIMSIGINPRWRENAQGCEYSNLKQFHEKKDFNGFSLSRQDYFSSEVYHGGYFTRLGTALQRAFFPDFLQCRTKSDTARAFFPKHVGKFDLLPWFSNDVKGFKHLSTEKFEPIISWGLVLKEFVLEKKPKAIIVNGAGYRKFVEFLLDVDLKGLVGDAVYGGRSKIEKTPIIVHRQLNAPGALGYEAYSDAVNAWKVEVEFGSQPDTLLNPCASNRPSP